MNIACLLFAYTGFRACNRGVAVLLVAVILALASGCSLIKDITPGLSAEPTHSVKTIQIVSTDKVNQDTAVAVDVVFIFDQKLVDALPDITARAWFREKAGYLARYPQSLAVFHYELVPVDSATISVKKLKTPQGPSATKARAVVLYANYLVETKAYTLDISGFKRPVITLDETTVSVRESKTKGKGD